MALIPFPWRFMLAAVLLFNAGNGTALRADDDSPPPFTVVPRVLQTNGARVVAVAFSIPTNHILYADKLACEISSSGGATNLCPFALPSPVSIKDKFSGHEKLVFRESFQASGILPNPMPDQVTLTVRYQGCDDANCFFPEEVKFSLAPDGKVVEVSSEDPAPAAASVSAGPAGSWRELAAGFTVSARGSGYLREKEFLALLDRSTTGEPDTQELRSSGGFWGLALTLGLILLGGAALNLTPCVLPMIPINIAIIGAGAQAGSKKRGFALGATYATGMALAYGVLGLAVVLTGSKFGTLNSSPWFNLVIAVVFIVLALGMFDVVSIDLSRLQGQDAGTGSSARSKFVVAYSMGTVAALLAGACVAPVVISVLLQATTLYNQGSVVGLFLPFVLGIGMGLPWPFAGAGLSFLPKPGRWMARVKYGFGVFIALFALYYGQIAFSLFRSAPELTASAAAPAAGAASSGTLADQLAAGLAEARASDQPVFIDFWASWCKNCSAMEHTTFEAPEVKRRLASFRQVRLQAEHPNQNPGKEVLDHFKVMGLPSYVILTPNRSAALTRETPGSVTAAQAR